MTYTTVSFFRDMTLKSLQRRQGFATRHHELMLDVIRSNMQFGEEVACFQTQEGNVVALHKNGLFVMV